MAKANQSTVSTDGWDQDHHEPVPIHPVPMLVKRKSKPTPKAQAIRDDWDDDDDDEEEEEVEDGNTDEGTLAEGFGGISIQGDSSKQAPQAQAQPHFQRSSSNPPTIDVWQEANARQPMPRLILTPSSTSQIPPPPPAALQPTLRILKRPSPSPSSSPAPSQSQSQSQPQSQSQFQLGSSSGSLTSSSTPGSGTASPTPRGTFAEREALYQEARNRIFGEKPTSSNANVNANPIANVNRDANAASGASQDGPTKPVVAIVRDPLGPASDLGGQDKGRLARGFGERRRGGAGAGGSLKKSSSDVSSNRS